MSLLFRVIFAAKAKSTHHKLALDALRHLRGALSDQWVDAFLYYADAYLTGSKAPDDKFKDFKNHVMHVEENYWGGAVESAKNWYDRTVAALRDRRWQEGAYSAGVLSHYFTDPFMPLHTAQSESEGPVHRPLEWSVTKSYEELQNLLIEYLGGYPEVQAPEGEDWLGSMIRAGARAAHVHYDALIDHYNVPIGVKDPPRGLDQECRERLAPLIGAATVGFARVLERAIEEADVSPPRCSISIPGFLESLDMPFQWISRNIHNSRERAAVEAVYEEFANTGKVINALSEDDRAVRRMHAEEVLKISVSQLDRMPARAPGTKHGTGAAPKPVCNWPVTSREASTTAYAPPRKTRRKPDSRRKESSDRSTAVASSVGKALPTAPAAATPPPAAVPTAPAVQPVLAVPPASVTKPPSTASSVSGLSTLQFPGTEDKPAKELKVPVREILNLVKGERAQTPGPKPESPRQASEAKLEPTKSALEETPEPNSVAPEPKRSWKQWLSIFKRANLGELTKQVNASTAAAPKEPEAEVEFIAMDTAKAKEPPQPVLTLGRSASPEPVQPQPAKEPTIPVAQRLKFYLQSAAPVVDAPSIGQKTARRLEAIGIKSVADFLAADVDDAAEKLGLKHLDAKTLREWQVQTRLALRVPNLRGHDAQILVGCGYKEPEQVARAVFDDLAKKVEAFCATSDGERILRGTGKPDAEEIGQWIEWAKAARPLKAA